jgi:GDP-4-dehydro-6-deoxy-D-mannose reductase
VRVLITGVNGFVGRHLANHLLHTTPDIALHGTVFQTSDSAFPAVIQHQVDLRNAGQTRELFTQVQPDQVYHLAALASVSASFNASWETLENNVRSQLNIIEACLSLPIAPRLLVVSSGEMYGPASPDELPSREDSPLRPSSPYSVSKVTQDMLGLQFFLSHQLPILRARPFNHLGPGQNEGFVAPDFGMQVARIEAGMQPPEMLVGNLKAERDFTDVRDVVRAYALVMRLGTPGEVYNVASGKTQSIQYLLDTLLKFANVDISVRPDPTRMRPSSIPILWGDASHLRQTTGWEPTIPFEQTLKDVLDDCRQRVQVSS